MQWYGGREGSADAAGFDQLVQLAALPTIPGASGSDKLYMAERRRHIRRPHRPYSPPPSWGRPFLEHNFLRYTDVRALPNGGDDDEVKFIYCIKLPGFECHTSRSTTPEVQHRQDARRLQSGFEYLAPMFGQGIFSQTTSALLDAYPLRWRPRVTPLPLPTSLPQYTMVKVGISTDPANRLRNIMGSFEEFGATDGTQFNFISESDSPDAAVEKGKREENVIFIQKCCSLRNAEGDIRQLLGQNRLGQRFRDQFKESLSDVQESYIKQVGMTEWILIPTALMSSIQQEFRRNWTGPGSFISNSQYRRSIYVIIGCKSGRQFYNNLASFRGDYRLTVPMMAYEVRIEFLPKKFSYSIRIGNQ